MKSVTEQTGTHWETVHGRETETEQNQTKTQ